MALQKRHSETEYLVPVLVILLLGFILVYISRLEKTIPALLMSPEAFFGTSGFSVHSVQDACYGFLFVGMFLAMHVYLKMRRPCADPFLLPAIAFLSGIGLIVILRLSPDLASSRSDAIHAFLIRNPDANVTDNVAVFAELGRRHFFSIAGGILVMFVSIHLFRRKNLSWLSSKRYLWIVASVVLVALTLLFGTKINHRRLWLFGFQTVELVKLLVIFFMAGYLYENSRAAGMYTGKPMKSWLAYTGPFLLMCFFSLVPIFLQRDFGPTVLLLLLFLFMFHYAGRLRRASFLFVMLIIAGGYLSYTLGQPPILRERFDMMADPFARSEGVSRALWAIASGGIFGAGIGSGQPYRVPEVQSDYTFTAVCEEMGFVGAAAVILAYAIVLHRCFRIASEQENPYARIMVTGIGTLTGLQAFIIMAGNLGIIPMTGITLPMMSYGGSSMAVNFLMMGIVIGISGEQNG